MGLAVNVLKRKFPSYVLQIGQSQFAIDQQLAEEIYVRLEKDLGK